MSIHQFSGGTIQKSNDFILRITFDVEDDISIEHLKEIRVIRESIFGDNYYCSLIDVRKDFMGISAEAKKYVAKNPSINKFRIAEALLDKNLGQKLGVDLYIRLFKPKRVSKVFLMEDKANKWLEKEYKKFKT
ncbi:MAG: hypothetical protein P1U41_04820 [Vicingaceae bacterium]|nr:hypothetical protein [Vicingaceae bacterium]